MPEDVRLKEVIRMIDTLFGDTSVPKSQTLEWMEEIHSHVGSSIDALKEDMEAEDTE